jgi:hypothetical protein
MTDGFAATSEEVGREAICTLAPIVPINSSF